MSIRSAIIQGYAYAGIFKARAAYARSCEVSIYVDHDARRREYNSINVPASLAAGTT